MVRGWSGQRTRHSDVAKASWRRRKMGLGRTPLRVTRRSHIRRGRRIPRSTFLIRDLGRDGRTPKEEQWFKPEQSIPGYTTKDTQRNRFRSIRNWANSHGGWTEENSLKLLHHFKGLENLTRRSNPRASLAYRQDFRKIDKSREVLFGSR